MYFNIIHHAVFHLAADSPVPIMREMTVLTVVEITSKVSSFLDLYDEPIKLTNSSLKKQTHPYKCKKMIPGETRGQNAMV